MKTPALREIRALHDAKTVTVYQAYPASIALAAVEAQQFVPPFRMGRMTWIKPSFLWMMYRSGWATKQGQERVLSIVLERNGFDWALNHGVLSHYDPVVHSNVEQWREAHRGSSVVVQWDPERDLMLRPLPHRTIQIGLRDDAVTRYVEEWTISINDVTELVKSIEEHARAGRADQALSMCPAEFPYVAQPAAVERLRIGN